MSDINGDFISLPVEPRLSVYMHEKAARLGIPVSGNFELTSRCNFSCRMCYIHSDNAGKREKELSADDWLKIGRQAADAGVVFLLLTGGEPFLREDFSEIYSGLKKNGFMLSINTNGSLLNEELFKLFKKDPPSRLNISLYGTSDNAYENLCGSRSFSRVADNIEKAVRNGIQVKLNYSITPFNRGETEDIFRFARELGLPVQYSAYMYPRLRTENVRFGENGGRFSPEEAAGLPRGKRAFVSRKRAFYRKGDKA